MELRDRYDLISYMSEFLMKNTNLKKFARFLKFMEVLF